MAKKQQTKNASLAPSDAQRMAALFTANTRSSGRFVPLRERMHTEYAGLTIKDFELHLTGEMGAGAVPILDDNTCVWAAIDIDNHDSDLDLPIKDVAAKIAELRLPLVPCRSKSGGIHCYLFMEEPQPALKVRSLMTKWAEVLGYKGHEVFPKQVKLAVDSKGGLQLGNWINLPYFGGEKTERYAWGDGRRVGLAQFLDHAERLRQTDAQLRALLVSDHPDAPPCVQRMYSEGVASGHRNEALYNITIYWRKRVPDGFENPAHEANQSVFAKALPRAEASRTVNSAGRPDMQYRCNEEPIRSLCDREACLRRKYGITPADAERLSTTEALPTFTNLVKYLTEPVRWEFQMDGIKVTNIMTEQLLDWRAMRTMIADRLTKIVPMIKNQEWERILHPLMKEARLIEAPESASINGFMRDRLREFAARTDLTNPGKDINDRKALTRGMPCVQVYEGERCVFFRGQDFVSYLKRTKSEELKGINLWFAIKDMGVGHTKLRAGGLNINLLYLPVKMVLEHVAPVQAPTMKSNI